jgi:hypothetical protein
MRLPIIFDNSGRELRAHVFLITAAGPSRIRTVFRDVVIFINILKRTCNINSGSRRESRFLIGTHQKRYVIIRITKYESHGTTFALKLYNTHKRKILAIAYQEKIYGFRSNHLYLPDAP